MKAFFLAMVIFAVIGKLIFASSPNAPNYDAATDEDNDNDNDNDEGSKLGANFYLNEFEARSHYAMFKVGGDDDNGGPGYYM